MTDLRAVSEKIYKVVMYDAEYSYIILDQIESFLREVAMEPSDDHRFHYRISGCTQCLEETINQDLKFSNALKEARSEAVAKDRDERTAQDLYKHSYERGYSEAREQVTRIFTGAGDTLFTANQILDIIRALKP